MTMQEIFDKVSTHLLTQGKKSKSMLTNTCLYRGPGGTSCAVGCLIKDEFYTEDLENKLSVSTPVTEALEKSGVTVTQEIDKLLRDLQKLHDGDDISVTYFGGIGNIFTPPHWHEGLQILADRYNLKFTPPTQL